MMECTVCVNVLRYMVKKNFKNLSVSRDSLNTSSNLHGAARVDSVFLHILNQEFCSLLLWVIMEATIGKNDYAEMFCSINENMVYF